MFLRWNQKFFRWTRLKEPGCVLQGTYPDSGTGVMALDAIFSLPQNNSMEQKVQNGWGRRNKGVSSRQKWPWQLPTPTLEFRLARPGMIRAWPFQARVSSNLASREILLCSTLTRYWLGENLGVSDLVRGNSWGHHQAGPTLGANLKTNPASVLTLS